MVVMLGLQRISVQMMKFPQDLLKLCDRSDPSKVIMASVYISISQLLKSRKSNHLIEQAEEGIELFPSVIMN